MSVLWLPLCTLALLLFKYGNYWSNYWWTPWSLCYWMVSIAYAWWFGKRTSMWLFPVIAVSLSSAVWLFSWNFNGYKELYSPLTLLSLGKAGAMAWASVVIGSFLFQLRPQSKEWQWKKVVYLTLQMVSVMTIFYTIGQIRHTAYTRGAFSGNASMNGSLMSSLLPLTFQWPVITVLGLFAICLVAKSIPLGVLGVTVAAWWFAKSGKQIKWGKVLVGAFGIGLCTGIFFHFHPFNDSGRFEIWKLFYRWWDVNSDPWMGAGLGSGSILFPMIQATASGGHETEFFLWAHNEWLQILFETGILGLISAMAGGGYVAVKSFRNPVLFGSIMGFLAMGFFNYPLRLPIHTFCFIAVAWLVLQENRNQREKG